MNKMRLKKAITILGIFFSSSWPAIGQSTVLTCMSSFDNNYPQLMVGVEPTFVRPNYIATIELDLGTQTLLELSGDVTFDAFGGLIGCRNPTWEVIISAREININSDLYQCNELRLGISWGMTINRITGTFSRYLGDLAGGTIAFSEGSCSSARQRF